ncbi:MAG: sialate O-acetylesterase [Kiritimatiellae bacterium]|nr:sialate O-acetylesterase [Kiritimatiellia bacterium]
MLSVTGGSHRIAVRALDGSNEVARRVVENVGVGEVFIMTGQSNAGNCGWPKTAPVDERVTAYCPGCKTWRHAYDPQPWQGGSGGSPWPAFGDAMARALDVPVGLLQVASPGSGVNAWSPTNASSAYNSVKNAIKMMGPKGVRAILWHQGETDVSLRTTADTYAATLNACIAKSREDAGWEIPWGIATVTFIPSSKSTNDGDRVRAGQRKVCEGTAVFQGPTTDDMIGPEWRFDTIHMNGKGLREHGRRWAESVLKNLFPDVPANAMNPTGATLAIASPLPGYVAQRNASNEGPVAVMMGFDGALTRVEVRWTPMKGGTPSAWTLLKDAPKDGVIEETVYLPAGWHKLDFRGIIGGTTVVERSIERVGVGEVFAVIGGEHVGNNGQTRLASSDPRVSKYDPSCLELPMEDPVQGSSGEKGSAWPAMGDALAAALDLPVELVVSGYGGTVEEWKPGTWRFHGGIRCKYLYCKRFPENSYRAVLWEVGELDAKAGTAETNYFAALTNIVTTFRAETGWGAPWIVAGTAFHPEAPEANRMAIRSAQKRVCDGKTIFEGPSTDDLTGPQWRYDGLHFTEAGQREHAKRWASAVIAVFPKEKAASKPRAK